MRAEEEETAVAKEKNESTLMMKQSGGTEGGWVAERDRWDSRVPK